MICVTKLKERIFRPESLLLHVATLMTGSALAQGVAVLLTPLIARLYSPDDFGVFAVFTSLLSTFSVVACWRFELAIVMPKSDEDAMNLVALSLSAALITGLVLFFVIILCGDAIAAFLGAPRLARWFWLLPLSVLASGCYQACNYLNTRNKEFRAVSVSQVGQTGSSAVLQAVVGFAHAGAVGLLSGQLIGQCAAIVILCRKGTGFLRRFFSVASFAEMRRLAGVYRQYPLVNTWPSLLNILASMLPVMFLSKFFGEETTGHFSLAMRVVTIPFILISSSVSQVMLPRFAEESHDSGATAALLEKTVGKLCLVGAALFGVLMFSPYVFAPVFGSKWGVAGTFAQILALSVAVKFVVSPISVVLLTLNRQDVLAYWQTAYVAATVAMLSASRLFMKPEVTVIFVSVTDVALYLSYLYLIFRITGARFSGIWSSAIATFGKRVAPHARG